jgi:integrase
MAYKIKVTGRWSAQGRDANGKRIQLGTFATRREAQAAEAEHKRQRPQSDITVTEWRKHWLTRREWKESTRLHNEERTKAFVDEYGKKRLGAINRTLAREFLHDHPSCLGALSAMFGAAMYEDDEQGNALLESNPFSRLVKRMASRRDLQADWMTAEDVAAIEETAFRTVSPWSAAIVRFAAETGIRPGELFVLEHRDLDPMAGVATIRRAADSKTRTVGLPKNGRAREVVLSAAAAAAARGGLDRVHSLTATGPADELVFPNPRGQQFWNGSWGYYWHQIRAAAGRPTMDFYELRHYCATRLLEHGLSDRDVAEQLGHTDGGELVRKVYGHPSKRRALDRVREALDGQEDA